MLRQRLNRLAPLFALLAALRAFPAQGQRGPIQDNSFLIEEAYNQERHVMQTIQTFTRTSGSGEWLYTLTQEFPIPEQKHQLSYTLPVLRTEDAARGVGDLAVNYRYQLLGDGDAKVAVSPRLSVLVPTGDADRGLGSGGWGAQVMLPMSALLGPKLVSHTNVGATVISGAKSGDDVSFLGGQSLVWLAHPNLNVMIEALVAWGNGGPDGDRHTDVTISPGLRFALDLPGGLQVVPGIAVPIGVGSSSGQKGIFLYLSFEHPFRRGAAG